MTELFNAFFLSDMLPYQYISDQKKPQFDFYTACFNSEIRIHAGLFNNTHLDLHWMRLDPKKTSHKISFLSFFGCC